MGDEVATTIISCEESVSSDEIRTPELENLFDDPLLLDGDFCSEEDSPFFSKWSI